jgi:protein subunit release factor A
METINLEIREAEGGKDARLLVNDMKNIYEKVCYRNNFNISTVD